VVTTAQFTYETLRGLGSMVGNLVSGMIMQFSDDENARTEAQANLTSASDSVAGPLGILGVIFPAAGKAGITQTIFLTAIISLSLAVVNILPIPALDGGRWLVMTIFKISKRKLTKELEEKIQMIGFAFIMALVILVTIADIAKIILV
jgi:regulator of sigma E protease